MTIVAELKTWTEHPGDGHCPEEGTPQWGILVDPLDDPYTIPRNRFLQILRYLHFGDNQDISIDKTNKMWKVHNVLDYTNRRFRAAYCTRELSIDKTKI